MARPRKDDALDIPGRAVSVAVDLLEKYGYAALTMNMVATAVGCRAPALYNHFENKDALLRAVHDEGFRRLYAEKLSVAADADGGVLKLLREGALAYLRFAQENPVLYQLMFSPPPVREGGGFSFDSDPGQKAIELLSVRISSCQAEGYLPGKDVAQIAFVLWSFVHGIASLVLQKRSPTGDENGWKTAVAAVDTVMEMITATEKREG